jgi:hypothetical protein
MFVADPTGARILVLGTGLIATIWRGPGLEWFRVAV